MTTQPKHSEDAANPASGDTLQQPEPIRAMQEHFYRTGYYRPEDVTRVLGNPRDTVEVTAGVGLPAAARTYK